MNYPVRSLRIAGSVWEDLRLRKYLTKLTWNRLLKRMLESDKQLNQANTKNYES